MFMNPQGPIGQVIGGYRIEHMLGPGATGAVFLGTSVTAPQTEAAIKILVIPWNAPPEECANFQTRFRHEAGVLQHLNHPAILPLLDFGEEQGMHYMVLPYMAGGTLADYLKQRGGTLPLNEAAAYLTRLASALDYAHSQHIIHRDIKPANVLLDTQGRPYLADFSIARLLDAFTKLTVTGQTIGTPAYMSPEQADAKNVGPAADIYSLGVVIYEVVTGRLPFQANSLPEFIKKHASELPPPPHLYRPGLPEAANAVILQALAKQPANRFPSAGAFAQAFAIGIQGQYAPGVRHPSSMTQQPTQGFTPPSTQRVSAPAPSGGIRPSAPIPPPPEDSPKATRRKSSGKSVSQPPAQPPQGPPQGPPASYVPVPVYVPVPAAPEPEPRGRGCLSNTLRVVALLLLLTCGGTVALGFTCQGPLNGLCARSNPPPPMDTPTDVPPNMSLATLTATVTATATATATPNPFTYRTSPSSFFKVLIPNSWQNHSQDFFPQGTDVLLYLGQEGQVFIAYHDPNGPGNPSALHCDSDATPTTGVNRINFGNQYWYVVGCDRKGCLSAGGIPVHEQVSAITYQGMFYQIAECSPANQFSSDNAQYYSPMEASFTFLT